VPESTPVISSNVMPGGSAPSCVAVKGIHAFDDDRACREGRVDPAFADVVDESHWCIDIHRGHLRAGEVANDLLRRHVLGNVTHSPPTM
jgi:hypothetical protein